MNFFENALCDLIDLEAKLESDAVDVKAGDEDCNDVIEYHLQDLRDVIEEFKKIHVGLVKQDRLMNELAEIQL